MIAAQVSKFDPRFDYLNIDDNHKLISMGKLLIDQDKLLINRGIYFLKKEIFVNRP